MNEMDYFEYQGKRVYYQIASELTHCKYNKWGELVRAQRMILFFNDMGDMIDSAPYYDDIEKVTNISKWMALDVYIGSCKNA